MHSAPGEASSASEAAGPGGGWQALTATERGASHSGSKQPNQDAVATQPVPGPAAEAAAPAGLVAAVADGHGHWRHFRSAHGSRLAVTVASEVMRDRAGQLDAQASQAELENEISQVVVPAIVDRWRAGVADHLAAEPFSSREEAFRFPGDDAVIAYGSTLLLATVWRHWLLLAQIGDGDIVAVQPGGAALRPVPDDPSLDGQQTTSLCEPQAVREFRVAAVDTTQTALLGVLLATDGYGNAQLSSPWAAEFGRELAGLLAQQGVAGVASELPGWAAQCASHDGSGDDTTIALLVSPGAGEAAAAAAGDAAAEDAGAEDAVRTNTVPTAAQPAPMLADTVPADMVPADAVPTDTIPADTVPADVVPADVGAGDAGPADTVPGDTVPGDTVPGDTVPGDTVPGDTVPGDTVPGDTVPGETLPADADADADTHTLPAQVVTARADPAPARTDTASAAASTVREAENGPEATSGLEGAVARADPGQPAPGGRGELSNRRGELGGRLITLIVAAIVLVVVVIGVTLGLH